MPREGTFPYTYTLPAVYLAVPGTTIVVAQHNTPLEDIQTTLNGIQPINFGGTGASTADGALTALGAASASQINYLAAGGSATVMTLTPALALPALVTGVTYPFKAIASSTGAATMNVSGLGAKAVRKIVGGTDVDIVANDILIGGYYTMSYSAAANTALGGWIISGSMPVTTFTDSLFRIQDNADATKQAAFEVSNISPANTRTLTVLNKNGTMVLAADVANAGMINGSITATVAGSTLSIGINTMSGVANPSAGDPVFIAFRDSAAATGDYVVRTISGALALNISSGSTMGTSNGVAFRLWIVAIDDNGTVRLAAVNALSGTSIMPLQDDQIINFVAEGGAGGADSAQTIYANAGGSSRAMRILGYLDFSTGQATAGTWATNPDKIALFGPGIKKPGDVVQVKRTDTGAVATGTTAIPDDDTIPQNTEGDQYQTQTIVPVGAPNLLRVLAVTELANSAVVTKATALFRDSTANAVSATRLESGTNSISSIPTNYVALAAAATSTTFNIRGGASTGATTTFNGVTGGRKLGGVLNSFIEISEIMA